MMRVRNLLSYVLQGKARRTCPPANTVYRCELATMSDIDKPPGLQIEQLMAERVPLICDTCPVDEETLRARLLRGDVCYMGFLDGGLAHYVWSQRQRRYRRPDTGEWDFVAPNDAWVYEFRTAVWARNRGIGAYMLNQIKYHYRGEGMHAVRACAVAGDQAAHRCLSRAGFTIHGAAQEARSNADASASPWQADPALMAS